MTVKHIQDLIANAVKIQLGGGTHKTHLYTKPYTKRVDALHKPSSYQPPKFQQFDGKGNPKCGTFHRDMQQCWHRRRPNDKIVYSNAEGYSF